MAVVADSHGKSDDDCDCKGWCLSQGAQDVANVVHQHVEMLPCRCGECVRKKSKTREEFFQFALSSRGDGAGRRDASHAHILLGMRWDTDAVEPHNPLPVASQTRF